MLGGTGGQGGGRCPRRADAAYEGTALSVCVPIAAKLKQQAAGGEQSGNERLGSVGSAGWLLSRLGDVNRQLSALVVASSARLPAWRQSLPHQLTLLNRPAL